MNRRAWLIVAAVLVVVVGLIVRNQINKASSNRESRAAAQRVMAWKAASMTHLLFQELQPVALANCNLERFGEAHDGGYLMCANLLAEVQAGYSYGIAGYDKWGCDISTKLRVRVHQYDCFDTTQPACPGGEMVFHAECIADQTKVDDGRPFDTFLNQFARNGDAGKRLVMKIDVEGAEWDAFLHAPEEVLDQLDQIAVEFHWTNDERFLQVVDRLKRRFHVAHLHFNNFSCVDHLAPFTAWAYEVLFVNKRVGVVDPSGAAGGVHPPDAPNNPHAPDCQAVPR